MRIFPLISLFILALLLCFISVKTGVSQPATPDREFRASWLTTTWGLDWPNPSHSPEKQKQTLLAILDRHVEQGMNAVIFQVVARGDALYDSETLPWAYVLTGQPGKDPGWDPLAFAVDEAHKRGLELHAWFNVFAVAYNTDSDSPPGSEQPNLRFTHPEWISSVTVNETTEHLWLNPGIPDARQWQVQNVMEIVEEYDVDAIHFDRIRYFSGGYDNDRELFAQYNPKGLSDIDDWRRYNVTEFVREASEQIRELKPWVKIGAAVSGHYDSGSSNGWPARFGYSEVYADSRLWAEKGYVDYLSPMNYWDITNAPRFDFISSDWADHSDDNYAVYMGTAPYKSSIFNELHQQIDVTRQLGIEGQVHFRYAHIEGISDRYRGRYSNTPLIPPALGKSQVPPAMVRNMTLSLEPDHLRVEWDTPAEENSTSDRHKFAIYCGTCGEDNERMRLTITGETKAQLPGSLWENSDEALIEVTALSRNYIESVPARQSIIVTNTEQNQEVVSSVRLHQNYPNPFNPTTQISFEIPGTGRAVLTVYDLTGRTIAILVDEVVSAGTHQVSFDGSNLSSGIYFYRLTTDSGTITNKMTLLK